MAPQAILNLYRFLQEACNNVIRHAHATAVRIEIDADHNGLSLVVADDGKGFDASQQPGNGLRNLQTRIEQLGGTFGVQSDGSGTRLRATVPLANAVDAI